MPRLGASAGKTEPAEVAPVAGVAPGVPLGTRRLVFFRQVWAVPAGVSQGGSHPLGCALRARCAYFFWGVLSAALQKVSACPA